MAAIALESAAALGEDADQTTRPLPQLLSSNELISDIMLTARGEASLDGQRLGVKASEIRLGGLLGAGGLHASRLDRLEAGAHRGDLSTSHMDPKGVEFGLQIAVTLGGLGLSLERSQLTTHLSHQVLEPEEVRLGRVEPTLRFLLPFPELQHPGGLLDDRAAILGARVQHGVDLALAHDDVLLATNPRVREQFLNVEESARHAVDRVFAVTGTEEDAGDGDLVELDREQSGRVVEGQAHLGPTKGRALRRAGEDDIVHLLGAHRFGRLSAEHPGDRVDDIRLP